MVGEAVQISSCFGPKSFRDCERNRINSESDRRLFLLMNGIMQAGSEEINYGRMLLSRVGKRGHGLTLKLLLD